MRDDAGAGLIATTTGVLVFLVLLLLAVQVTYHLYATSMVTAAAFDGARLAAGAASTDDAVARDHVLDLLGTYGRERVEALELRRQDGVVTLRVVAQNPGFLPTGLRRPMGLDRVDRTVRVRVEQEVAPS